MTDFYHLQPGTIIQGDDAPYVVLAENDMAHVDTGYAVNLYTGVITHISNISNPEVIEVDEVWLTAPGESIIP